MKKKIFIGALVVTIIATIIYCAFFSKQISSNTDKMVNDTENSLIIPSLNNFEELSVEDFKAELDRGEAILLDIRTPEELVTYGVISENQKHIIYGTDTFESEINTLDKNKKYLVYCWHGNRSKGAKEIMKDAGFLYVKDLKGGIDVWGK